MALELRLSPAPVRSAWSDPFASPVSAPVLEAGARVRRPLIEPRRPELPASIAPSHTLEPPRQVAPMALELAVYYALHRAGVCVKEPIEVERRDRDGALVVRGVVSTGERRAQIRRMLDDLAEPLLQVEIQTVEEAFATLAPQAAPVPPASHETPGPHPLARYFPGGDRDARQFAASLVGGSDGLAKEAQALAALAERFGRRAAALPAYSRWLLGVMVREHMSALTQRSEQVRDLLRSMPGVSDGLPVEPAEAPRGRELDAGWPEQVVRLFARARELDRGVRELASERAGGGPREVAARRLLDEVAACREQVRRASTLATSALEPGARE
jgi:hypothetical protein